MIALLKRNIDKKEWEKRKLKPETLAGRKLKLAARLSVLAWAYSSAG